MPTIEEMQAVRQSTAVEDATIAFCEDILSAYRKHVPEMLVAAEGHGGIVVDSMIRTLLVTMTGVSASFRDGEHSMNDHMGVLLKCAMTSVMEFAANKKGESIVPPMFVFECDCESCQDAKN